VIYINLSAEALLLTAVVSIDVFAASFAYGSSKIKITWLSVMVITVIGSVMLGSSLYFSVFMQSYIPDGLADILSFGILFTLGLLKIFDSVIKNIIRKHNDKSKQMEFSAFNLKFILNVYANPEQADIDKSKTLSPKEAAAVAVAVALDAFALGFGAGLTDVNHLQIVVFSFILDIFAVVLGCYTGVKIAKKSPFNLSWLGGVILIVMAIL
jgi:putative sporulation protein YtaF